MPRKKKQVLMQKTKTGLHRGILPLALIIIVGIGLQTLYVGQNSLPDGMHRIDTGNEKQMKEVFFGGQPWLLLCTNETNPHSRITKILTLTTKKLGNAYSLGVLNCEHKLPSGHSVSERFKIKLSKSRTALVLSANGRITQISRKKARSWKTLKTFVEGKSQVRFPKVGSAKQWSKHCIKQRVCAALLVAGQEKKTIQKLARKHRGVQFVVVNTTHHHLEEADGEPFLGTVKSGRPAMHIFKRNMNGALSCTSYSGAFTLHNMAKFVSATIQDEVVEQLILEENSVPRIVRNVKAIGTSRVVDETSTNAEKQGPTEEELLQRKEDQLRKKERRRRERMEQEAESYIPQAGDVTEDTYREVQDDEELEFREDEDEVELGDDEDEVEFGDDEDEVELGDDEDEGDY